MNVYSEYLEAKARMDAKKLQHEKMLQVVFDLYKAYVETHHHKPTHVLIHTNLCWNALLLHPEVKLTTLMGMQVIEVANMDEDFLKVIYLPKEK